jgi:hypothetical protein
MRFTFLSISMFIFSSLLFGQEYLIGVKAANGSSIVNNYQSAENFYKINSFRDEKNSVLMQMELNVEYKKGLCFIGGLGYMKQNTMVTNVHSITVPLGVGVVLGNKFCFHSSLQARTNFLLSPTNIFVAEDMLGSNQLHIYKASPVQLLGQWECGVSYRYNESTFSASIIHSFGLTSILESETIEDIWGANHYSHGVLYSISYKKYFKFKP